MLVFVEGVYRDGKVELLGPAPDQAEAHRVVVTFLPPATHAVLAEDSPGTSRAAELRATFGAAAKDWDDPAMDIYNDM